MSTIPKWLEEKRDEGAEKYGQHIVANMHSLGTYKQADFKEGFTAAVNLLLPELVAARDALEWYAAGRSWNDNFGNEESCAVRALSRIEEKLK